MVASLAYPLNIFIIGLGGGFLIPLLSKAGQVWTSAAFVIALVAMTAISGISLFQLANGAPPIEILTGGSVPPYSINLRLGLGESIFTFSVGVVALLGAAYFVRAKYTAMVLYLVMITGVFGMIMTRDLFNLFVFLEIVSIATYGLLGLNQTPAALSASFKYLMATVIASTFFLLGTLLLYSATGILNIDDLIAHKNAGNSAFGFAALIFLLACLLVELKPFPANGWGLDVYETAPGSVAALISVVVSAGAFFALAKLLPLFEGQLQIIAALGAATFLLSNLIGLAQGNARRLLGYSSIGQMGLLTLALALLYRTDAADVMPLIVVGLFVNHLLAKAGLFWLAEYAGARRLEDWSGLARRPAVVFAFGALLAAIAGLPPFPAFWAKWHLVLDLAARERHVWIAVILTGSLLEAAYLFRWFGKVVQRPGNARDMSRNPIGLPGIFATVLLLALGGYYAAILSGLSSSWVFVPLGAGAAMLALDRLPGHTKALLVFASVTIGGFLLVRDQSGISFLFATLLYAGGAVLSLACLYRKETRRGFYPLLAVMLLALPALPRSANSLEFFFLWELITLSSYLLVVRRPETGAHALSYLLFSLVAAFFVLVGFATAHAASGSTALTALWTLGPSGSSAFVLFTIGFLIKAAAIGVHVWLPAVYAEAEDDVSAMLSALVSKAPMFGLLVCTYIAAGSSSKYDLAYVIGFIGMMTTLAGAMMAVRQDDIKYMLAYSSMSQLGYIVTAISLLSYLGWVTALYLVANHLAIKGILFLVAAGVALRFGSRKLAELSGLARRMPFTFVTASVAILAMSGLPPLVGFGGKWLLLHAMIEKGWYAPLAIGVLATFVGLLYMARIMLAFLGEPSTARTENPSEAPVALLIPQYLLVLGIVVISFFPTLLIAPISAAIDPYFASTLVWEGMSLEMIYDFWNPVPTMTYAVGTAAILIALLWLLYRASASNIGLYIFYDPVFAKLTPPIAQASWDGVPAGTEWLAQKARRIYTGNGQTYSLLVVYYLIALYAASRGLGFIQPWLR